MASPDLDINIRFAKREDCEALVDLSKESAVHQMEDRRKPTVQDLFPDLKRDGFDEEPPQFRCVVAECISRSDSNEIQKKIVGYALYSYYYPIWKGKYIRLDDLCVTSNLRGKGIGGKLVKSLAIISIHGKISRIRFEVLESNESGIKFFKKLGLGAIDYTTTEGWHQYEFEDSSFIKILKNVFKTK